MLVDADNHYYEAEDAFTRSATRASACVTWRSCWRRRMHLWRAVD